MAERIFAFQSEITCAFVLIIIYLCQRKNNSKKNHNETGRLFSILLLLLTGILVAESIGWLVDKSALPAARILNEASMFIYYLLAPTICYLWYIYVLFWVSSKTKYRKLHSVFFLIPLVCSIALALINPFLHELYFIDSTNTFRLQKFKVLNNALCFSYELLVIITCVVYTLLEKDKDKKKHKLSFILYTLPTAAGFVLTLFISGYSFIWPAMTLSMLLLFIKLENEKITNLELEFEKEKALMAEENAKIMVKQINPHFLFNALNAVIGLYEIDRDTAEQTIFSFSNVLRASINAATKCDTISFDQELSEAKDFLNIEVQRFPNVYVEYAIETSNFFIPTMTLQPLLENAIKHGVYPKKSGGKVTVKTSTDEKNFYVYIIDNGVGFDTSKVSSLDKFSSISIVKSRLENICNGRLEIESKINSGTSVKITIPCGKTQYNSI